MIFDGILIDPEWVSDCVSDQMFKNILIVLPCPDPFQAVTHDWETFSLIDGHAFLKVS